MLATGNQYEAAILARGADFFLVAYDPRKRHLRERFLTIVRAAWGVSEPDHVPFANGYLPYYRFTPANPRGTAAVLRAAASYRTQEISPPVRQDVLLLAGAEDHYIRAHQVYDQAARLTNARSVTTRMFSRAESAQAHCQIGNLPLAIQAVTDWLDRRLNTAAG